MVSESVRDLESGDILKLASKVHARFVITDSEFPR